MMINFLSVCITLSLIGSFKSFPVNESLYDDFVITYARQKCFIPRNIIVPSEYKTADSELDFSVPLQVCKKVPKGEPKTSVSRRESIICKVMFDFIAEIACDPKINIEEKIEEPLSLNICNDFINDGPSTDESHVIISRLLTCSMVCDTEEMQHACKFVIWLYKVHSHLQINDINREQTKLIESIPGSLEISVGEQSTKKEEADLPQDIIPAEEPLNSDDASNGNQKGSESLKSKSEITSTLVKSLHTSNDAISTTVSDTSQKGSKVIKTPSYSLKNVVSDKSIVVKKTKPQNAKEELHSAVTTENFTEKSTSDKPAANSVSSITDNGNSIGNSIIYIKTGVVPSVSLKSVDAISSKLSSTTMSKLTSIAANVPFNSVAKATEVGTILNIPLEKMEEPHNEQGAVANEEPSEYDIENLEGEISREYSKLENDVSTSSKSTSKILSTKNNKSPERNKMKNEDGGQVTMIKSDSRLKPADLDALHESSDFSEAFSEQDDSHFFVYFLVAIASVIGIYLVYHNKQKILALLIEGRHDRRRRSHNVSYKKLET